MLKSGALLNERYIILQKVAEGGFGAVYKARDQNLGGNVAIKQLLLSRPDLVQSFKREAKLLRRLNHPSLPRVLDSFEEQDAYFLVMDFIDGKDLAKGMDNRVSGYPVMDVLLWGIQLLTVLEYLHQQRPAIIHRDIKPANLKLDDDGDLILLDFGLAKGYKSASFAVTDKSIFGYTPYFAPPEQVNNQGTTERSDVFSVAATLYCLLTLQPPPDVVLRASAIAMNQTDPLSVEKPSTHNTNVPKSLDAVLKRALSLDPQKRYTNASEFRRALEKVDQGLERQREQSLARQLQALEKQDQETRKRLQAARILQQKRSDKKRLLHKQIFQQRLRTMGPLIGAVGICLGILLFIIITLPSMTSSSQTAPLSIERIATVTTLPTDLIGQPTSTFAAGPGEATSTRIPTVTPTEPPTNTPVPPTAAPQATPRPGQPTARPATPRPLQPNNPQPTAAPNNPQPQPQPTAAPNNPQPQPDPPTEVPAPNPGPGATNTPRPSQPTTSP